MKQIILASACFLLLLAACKRTSDDGLTPIIPNNNPNPTDTTTPPKADSAFSYTVDNNNINIDSAYGSLYTSSLTQKRIVDVFAFKNGSLVFEMHFQPVLGNQIVTTDLNYAWLTYVAGNNFPQDQYDSRDGNFALTVCDTINKKIQGTFDFIGNNGTTDKKITNGKLFINKLFIQ